MGEADPLHATRRRTTAAVPPEADVVVIGSGLGGLGAGAWLARAGLRVVVLEAHYVAGGCATRFARRTPRGRFAFDVGVHYVGDCGPVGLTRRLLEGVGVEVDWRPLDPEGFDVLHLPGLTFRIPADREAWRDRLLALFPAEGRAIDRYHRFLVELQHMARVGGPGGLRGLRLAWEGARRARSVLRWQRATAARLLDACGMRDPLLRAVVLGQNGDYGLPPGEVSALLHGGLQNHYFSGAWYPRGGGQVLADGLADVVEEAGGAVCLAREVASILVEDGRAVGVRTRPRRGVAAEVRARVVISNADILRTWRELLPPEALPRAVARRLATWRMAEGIFMTCLGVDEAPGPLPVGPVNHWAFDTVDFDRLYEEGRRTGPLRPQAIYLTSATAKDPGTPGHAPPGFASVEVMTLVPAALDRWVAPRALADGSYRRDPAYLAAKARIEEELVARADRLFPGLAQRVVFRESATPVTHARFTRASAGTGYGLASTPDQFLARRPGASTPVPGLFLAGASTRSGHGVLGALLSGWHAAHAAARELGRSIPLP